MNGIEIARAIRIETVIDARALGLRRQGHELVGPCPRCGGTDRFQVHAAKNTWLCRQCPAGGGVIDLVMHLRAVDFRVAVAILAGEHSMNVRRMPAPTAPPTKKNDDAAYARQQARKAGWLWSQRRLIAGTTGETYLREARGCGGTLPPTLAFLPARGDHGPAMIAAFGFAQETEPGVLGEPADVGAVHLTKLAPGGRGKAETKPNKIVVGSPDGRPIVLAPVNDLLGLAVTEGIEDALSVAEATGLGVWAAGSASFMPALADAVPGYVECVTIYGHADPAGERGARELAERLVARGVEVFVEGLAS